MIELLFANPIVYLMMVVSIILALSIHEYSHAQAADFLGDSTAKEFGRLTINPLKHFDPVGALLLFTIGFGWGKPVPFNPLNLRNKRWGPGLVGLAGPGSNFLMAVLVGSVLRFLPLTNPGVINFFVTFIWLNILLGVFNLIPVPPLDGSHILFSIVRSQNLQLAFLRSGFVSIIIAIFLMAYVGVPFICQPLFSLITGIPLPF